MGSAGGVGAGYGAYLVQMTLALGAMGLVALFILRALKQRLPNEARGLRVVARLAIEANRSVVVIEAGGRYLLVGVGDGPMALLTELEPNAMWNEPSDATRTGWLELARKIAGGRGGAA